MELLGDMGQVEAHFCSFAASVKSRRKDGAQFALNIPWVWKSFLPHPKDLISDVAQIEAHFGLFGDSVNLTQDSCTAGAKHAIGS
jgi:hypothetical protein